MYDYALEVNIDNVKTKTVESLITPLVYLLTTLHANMQPLVDTSRDGISVLELLKEKLREFVSSGQKIIQNHPYGIEKVLAQLIEALNKVNISGNKLLLIGSDFIKNTDNTELRSQTVDASRDTLLAVVQLLVMADMVDVELLLNKVEKIREHVQDIELAQTKEELLRNSHNLEIELKELTEMTKKRVRDLKNPVALQDDLQAAIAMLKITTPIMIASSKAFIQHPRIEGLKINQQYAVEQINHALNCYCDAVQGKQPQDELAISYHGKINDLAINFEKFQRNVYMDPSEYRPTQHRQQLEELLERIASGSGLIADLKTTRPGRRVQIITGVNNLRQALQDLLKEYENNIGSMEPAEDLDLAKVYLAHKVRDLRRHIRRAIVDHISDAFLDTQTPLLQLVESALTGNFVQTEQALRIFQEHANNIVTVARLVSNVSNDIDGVRVLRYIALLCEKISPQISHAALLLCRDPDSIMIKENMVVLQNSWLERVKVLKMALDSLISVDDFLAVSEIHIIEDCENGIKAIVGGSGEVLDQQAGYIRGRSLRVCEVVLNDVCQLPANPYSENVKRAAMRLRENVLPKFERQAQNIMLEMGKTDSIRDANRNMDEMIETANLVHGAVTDIRHALLMNRNPEDVDSDNEYEEDSVPAADASSQASVSDTDNQQQIMRQLPEESKRKIQEQIDVFKITQRKFEYEVGKWDETGNDIIALAKKMCQIMMNMTDFTKGRGPYKTTMDVIKAAQKISEYGGKLNALARQIGQESVESNTKSDLFAYLDRITLFCHQLNVINKVKADIQVVGDDLRLGGLEAATSLIQNAKNLLNAVILTVKSAYIASTKYRRKESTKPNVVEWRMAAPQKQPLVNAPAKSTHGVIRRASERRQPPIQTLTQFQIST